MMIGDHLQTPFAKALAEVESPDPRRRLAGISQLLEIADARALQVARTLQRDEDPDIRLEATRVCIKLQADGVRERLVPGQEQARERSQLNSVYEVLDEVFFALSRNFGAVAWSAVVAGALKLAGAAVLIWWHPTGPVFGYRFESMIPVYVMAGFALQQLFVRPLSWILIGRAVLGGFADQVSRRLGEAPISAFQVMQVAKVNLYERLKLVIPIGLLAVAALSPDAGAFLSIFAVFILLSVLRLNPLNLPMQLLLGRAAGDSMTQAAALARERDWVIRFSWSNFLAQTCGLYILFTSVFLFLLDFFFGCNPPRSLFASLLLADTVLDPFWIGYRLLTARLVLNCSQRVNA